MSARGGERFTVDVRLDAFAMMWKLKNISDKLADKAMLRAMNDTVKHIRTEIKRPIAAAMGAKVGAVAKRLKVRFAHLNMMRASVIATGKPWNLAEFKSTRQTSRGVTSAAWGQSKVYPHTFIAKFKSGHVGVYKKERTTDGLFLRFVKKIAGKKIKRKGQLVPVWGPGVPKTMATEAMKTVITTIAREHFIKRLKHHVDFLTKGA